MVAVAGCILPPTKRWFFPSADRRDEPMQTPPSPVPAEPLLEVPPPLLLVLLPPPLLVPLPPPPLLLLLVVTP
jgi:hypothetical protein